LINFEAPEVFITIAETGSMTAAAKELKITQSAISQQLKFAGS
jgi:DNA-binding transcriptional LysR family regulator